jgi:hypothetical protein
VVIAAVAATGIAIGRWGIPADDSTGTTVSGLSTVATSGYEGQAAQQKFAQMDAAEDARDAGVSGLSNVVTGGYEGQAAQQKFAQMDAAEDARDAR